MSSDVTAIVLSIGEPYAERAVASVERQTLSPADIVRVENVTPFHRALNTGIARVRTEYFLHVDADMVLDPTCIADLRACMAPGVAVAIGGLRDSLRGNILGIKLFRTEAAAHGFPDAIAPDVELISDLIALGWTTAAALKYRPGPRALWHTFGEHQPDYSPLYTFNKFRIMGARYRALGRTTNLRRMMEVVGSSGHPNALIAQVAATAGLFWQEDRDVLRPYRESQELDRLQNLIDREAPLPPSSDVMSDPLRAFLAGYRSGSAIADRMGTRLEDGPNTDKLPLRGQLERYARQTTPSAWLAFAGVCRGVFAPALSPDQLAADGELAARAFVENPS